LRILILSVGNRLRRDDGVAHYVVNLLKRTTGVQTRAVFQLTPDLAQEIADFDAILFIDADASAAAVSLERLEPSMAHAPTLTHVSQPAEVVELSRVLFGFNGKAYLCRIPVEDLSAGEGLSLRAAAFSEVALSRIEEFVAQVECAATA